MDLPFPIFGLPVRDFKKHPLTYAEKIAILTTCELELSKKDLAKDLEKIYSSAIEIISRDIRDIN